MKMLVNIKKIVLVVSVLVLAIVHIGCDNSAIYEEEHYKNIVYLLSGENNIFNASYSLEPESERWVTIGCGGSNTNDKSITVTLAPAPELLQRYNSLNFNDPEQFAKLMPASMYDIDDYVVNIPAKSDYHSVRMPVRVRPIGQNRRLSPDTTYFIPLKIESVSEYEVNEDKQNILFRVAIENDFASQLERTNYSISVTQTNPDRFFSGLRRVHPLTANRVRMFVSDQSYTDATTREQIDRYSIIVHINDDNSVTVLPYGSIQIDMLHDREGFNRYDPNVVFANTVRRILYLRYQYQLRNADGSYAPPVQVQEVLTRVEN